jgi:DNA polymerase elongation subunit (family B)
MYQNYVVEKDGYICKENERYTGAYVFDPVPGVYDMVVSFDFSSLYPSTIIAYNIDYTTLVSDESIPDDKCNIFEWEDHLGCEHDKTVRKTKPKNIVCGYNKFRFLKEPKGIVPALLENLLNSRKKINGDIAKIKEQIKTLEDENKKKEMQSLLTVLDKRQLAMKISANSVYGGFGVRRGYLPFMPGAMCTTARGRESIEKAAKHVQENYGAKLIYGDTDSCYVSFPQFKSEKDARECYDFCKQVEEDMLSIFPRPMKFAYEEKIYWRFFILTKKRYMALQCDKKGIVSNNIFKRGVLLNRRDSNKILRKIYSELMLKIFFKEDKNTVLYYIIEEVLKLFQLVYSPKEFVSTKSVGKNEDYKIRDLPEDDKKREKRLKELNCTKEEYRFRCLPAQVQLAEKMRKRGKRVDPGSLLEFVITDKGGLDANLFDKIEDVDYFMDHREVLRLDYFYYLNLFINPIDQVIQTAYGIEKFLKTQYNYMIKKYKMLGELGNFVKPNIELL